MGVVRGIGAAIAMVLLILDSKCALSGAAEGIELCIRTVIPTLFPFFLLSAILTPSLPGMPRAFTRLFRVNRNAGSVLLTGLLGGYPVGAQAVSQAYVEGTLTKAEAQRLLPICNQCGPAFLFGMTGALFGDLRISLMLWLIQIASVMIVARLIPGESSPDKPRSSAPRITLPQAMKQSIHSMASVCGWIVIFRILYRFLERWLLWYFPADVRIGICGILELANGCVELQQLPNPDTRLMMCAMMMSFGGLCVTMQTFGVIHNDLDRRLYFPGKLLQAGICLLLLSAVLGKLYPITIVFTIIAVFSLIILRKTKKAVAFHGNNVYNGSIKHTRILLCSSEKR